MNDKDTSLPIHSLAARVSFRAAEGRHRYRARLVSAGQIRTISDEPGDLVLAADAIADAVARRLFEGLACFVDHAEPDTHPSLRDLFGVWHDVVWDAAAGAAEGLLTVYGSDTNKQVAAVLDQVLADAASGAPVPDIGISLVFYPEYAGTGRREVVRFRHVESADIVFFPAADGRLLEALDARRAIHKGVSEAMEGSLVEKEVVDEALALAPETAAALAPVERLPDDVETPPSIAAWAAALREQVVAAALAHSGLPEVVQRRLARQPYETPQALQAAVREAAAELQALDAAAIVDLEGGRPRRGALSVVDPLDEIQRHVNWFFGAPEAAAPPANLRRLEQLYVALTGDSEFHGLFHPERVTLAGATTATLANMAVSAMNRVIATQFSLLDHWRWYERVTTVAPNDGSVHDMQWISFGGVGDLPSVAEGAAYTELTVDDARESDAFTKYGGYVGITLEMIRNSNLMEIQAVPRALAISALRTRSAAVAGIFTANAGVGPTLDQDSTALFNAAHNNVAADAFGETAWRAARAECFQHTELNSGKALAVFPRYALVPAELYDTALATFGYGQGMPTSYKPEAQDRGFADPRPVPLAVPDWTDANDWAYITDPHVFPVIFMSYAQAPGGGTHPAPELYTVLSETQGLLFTNDVLPVKVRDWFAYGVNGARGIGKRNVV